MDKLWRAEEELCRRAKGAKRGKCKWPSVKWQSPIRRGTMKARVMSGLFVRTVLTSAVLAVSSGILSPAPALLKTAPLKYRQRTLANGLTVLSIENHQSPTAAIQVWYHVGGKDDPAGRSGFAHLFEHMMLKSTKNQKNENFDRLTEDVGGANNAFTQEDATVYHETVPSNYLETLLWAEADRMANLSVNEANFVSERAVVEEEYPPERSGQSLWPAGGALRRSELVCGPPLQARRHRLYR